MLRAIPPTDISFEWDRVRAGLLVVKQTTSDDWLPEDIYMAVKAGSAVLWIGEDEHGEYEGFLILNLVQNFHSKSMHVWCAYSATDAPLMRRYLPQIMEIAKVAQAQKVTFSSDRSEWEAVSRRLGFKQGKTSYELDL